MVRLKGPDSLRLLNKNSVNNFTKLDIGAVRHAIMCSEKGNILATGDKVRGEQLEQTLASYYGGR